MKECSCEKEQKKLGYPNIRYHLYSGNEDDVTVRLDKGLLDFGILIQAADLLNVPLICSRQAIKQAFSKNEFADWFGEDFEKLNVVTTYNLAFNASLMVKEGIGYAITLDKIVNTSSDSNLCFRPLKPRLESGLNIVWKKHQVFSAAAEMFLKEIQAKFTNYF
jgi:DNA-binding transcriptional LysR family regulator